MSSPDTTTGTNWIAVADFDNDAHLDIVMEPLELN
jgi:hypothetical protein